MVVAGWSHAAPSGTNDARSAQITRQLESADDEAITDVSPPPAVTASGWLVFDVGANEAIAGEEAGTAKPIASLAKLMTAVVVLERVDLDAKVAIPAAVDRLPADAARMDARPGERWPARDLLRAMLVHSANDAAIALASHVSDGSVPAFVGLMNEEATELGMSDTEFASPTGLDLAGAPSTSTPIDLVALAQAVLGHEEARTAMAERSITLQRPAGGAPIKLANRNPLLGSYEGVDGIKTGFTDAAGYMLAVHHTDAATEGELIVVTFASSSEKTRVGDSRALLDWARSLRTDVRVVEGGTMLGSVPVQRSSEQLPVFACDDVVVTARVGQRIVQEVVVPRSVAPPIAEGDEVGQLRVRVGTTHLAGEEPLPATVPICSATSIASRTRAERAFDYARDWRGAWETGVDEVEDAWSSLRKQSA